MSKKITTTLNKNTKIRRIAELLKRNRKNKY
jgi:hypothetical protein